MLENSTVVCFEIAAKYMYVQKCLPACGRSSKENQMPAPDMNANEHTLLIPQSILNLAGLKRPARLRPVVQAQPDTLLRLVHRAGVLRNNLFGRGNHSKLGGRCGKTRRSYSARTVCERRERNALVAAGIAPARGQG